MQIESDEESEGCEEIIDERPVLNPRESSSSMESFDMGEQSMLAKEDEELSVEII